MKSTILSWLILWGSLMQAQTSPDTVKENCNIVGFSFGLGANKFYNLPSKQPDFSSLPALNLTYERIVATVGAGNINVGVLFSYKRAFLPVEGIGYQFTDAGVFLHRNYTNYKFNCFVIAPRVSYHLRIAELPAKLDPYLGLSVGAKLYRRSYKLEYEDPEMNAVFNVSDEPVKYKDNSFIIGGFLGARYNVSSSFGVFLEVGYDASYGKIGAAMMF